MLKPFFVTVLLASFLFINACSTEDPFLKQLGLTEEDLYQHIQVQLNKQQYSNAIESLQAMEAQFPFGKYAEQSQLDLIYAYYRQYEYEAASATAERFIRLHPQHQHTDYAYYMKGLASFTEGSGLFERFMPTDLTLRDPGAARQSFADFSQMLSRFPDSQYAADARKRMVYLRNLLARYEVHVASYYFKRGAYLAAANRGRYVVENFQRAPAVPDALATMTQAYQLLGLQELADDAQLALQSNYPDHEAFDENGNFIMHGAEERSWVNALSFGLIDPPQIMGFDSREEKR